MLLGGGNDMNQRNHDTKIGLLRNTLVANLVVFGIILSMGRTSARLIYVHGLRSASGNNKSARPTRPK
jgi:hypothetical protein